ncbi:putative ribonuclease H-like domain-containing protein [Tanacetum coccineum]
MGLLTMDDGIVNWGEHTEAEETNHALMLSLKNELGDQEAQILAYSQAVKKLEAQLVTFQKQQFSLNEKLTFQANEIYEKLNSLNDIGDRNEASQEKEQLQKHEGSYGNTLSTLLETESESLDEPNEMSKSRLEEPLKDNETITLLGRIGNDMMERRIVGRTRQGKLRTNISSGRPKVNTVSPKVNTASSKVNTVRPRPPAPHKTSNSLSPKRPQMNQINQRRDFSIIFLVTRSLEDFEDSMGDLLPLEDSKGYILENRVLFTETECLVVSSDFKMPDENQILLKVPRHHNMYSFDMKTPSPAKGFACLIAKATSDESKLWHKRLSHINFKNLNKLVKGNLVRGLPSKVFKNDHTCVACHKRQKHRLLQGQVRKMTHQATTHLHMDLFGPTSVKSINHASYCLVITDDCTRFCWVFFLASKDETSGILQTFIRQIENQLSHRVKIIRSDNGTEFKNRDMLEFCGNKGIKNGVLVMPELHQQTGVAERNERTSN